MKTNYALPLISIITPSFNQGQYLEKCIDSILSQNYPSLEYIIIDGGSTDSSVEIIKKYSKHITYWQSKPDNGHYNAVNEGFARAKGEIFCWLNSDDMLHPGALSMVANIFTQHADILWITGKRVGFDAHGRLLSFGFENQAWSRDVLLDTSLIDRHIFVMQEATFWRRDLWDRVGGALDTSFDLAADFDLWARFSRYARLYSIDSLLGGYRFHGMQQRSQAQRDTYLKQCKQIISREQRIPSSIQAYDADPPSLVSCQQVIGSLQILREKPFPKLSLVTPSFNQGEFLEECIDSVLSQNYPNLEYIIMDGGSSDNSVEIIRKYEKHLTYWQSQPDGGQYNAINEGFKKTSGEIMAWLNSDDKYHRDAFFKAAYLFESCPEVEWLTGRPSFWSKDGCLARFEAPLPRYCRQDFLEGKFSQPFIQQESTFWRRSLWESAGGCLRTDLEYAGDLDLWMRFFRHALLHSVNSFFAGYRSHGEQKAVLFMDRYLAEAEVVIAGENQTYALPMHPAAPTPLTIDLGAYRDYLAGLQSEATCSPALMTAAESSLQHMLQTADTLINDLKFLTKEVQQQQEKRLQFEMAAQNINTALQAANASLHLLESSLSWRITKPLRWLGDKIREL